MMNKAELKSIVLKLLECDDIGDDVDFIRCGGDSMFFGRLQIEIKRTFGKRIPIAKLFASGTVNSVYALLDDEVQKKNEFSMTELQKAYSIGSKEEMPLGGIGSHALFSFEGHNVDHDRLRSAIRKLTDSQEMLRAFISGDDSMCIVDKCSAVIEDVNISTIADAEKESRLAELENEFFERPFNKSQAPLIRFLIVKKSDADTVVFVSHYGIIADGESHKIMLRQINAYYSGEHIEKHCSFMDYATYLASLRDSEEYAEARQELRDYFDGYDMNPELPVIRNPEEIHYPKINVASRSISRDDYRALCVCAMEYGLTPFALLLTLFGKAVGKYAGNDRFMINLPVAQRPAELNGVNELVGLCSDFMLFDFDNASSASLAEQAEINQQKLFSIREYSMYYSGTELLKDLHRQRHTDQSPSVVFTSTIGADNAEDAVFRKSTTRTFTSQVWLEGLLTDTAEGVLFTLSSVADMFDPAVADGIADIFAESVVAVIRSSAFLKDNCSLPLSAHDTCLINEFNSKRSLPAALSFRERIDKNADKFGKKPAIVTEDTSVSYAALRNYCRSLAHLFTADYGISDGDAVGLLMQKGMAQIVAENALAYMNITFLPIDLELPADAVSYCGQKTGLKLIVTDADNEAAAAASGLPYKILPALDSIPSSDAPQSFGNEIMMMINTSGTTGFPKTVMLRGRAVTGCFLMSEQIYGVSHCDTAFGITNYSHDMSVFDILGMTYIGGTVVVPEQKVFKDPAAWVNLMKMHKVTFWNSVPAFMEMLLLADDADEVIANFKTIVQGGDYTKASTCEKIRMISPDCRIFNVGGPTETTIWNIFHEVTDADISSGIIPYGKPFPNAEYFILDKNMQLCPVGKEGTMFIAGPSVAAGYAGDPDSDKFTEYCGRRVYNTGDNGVYLPCGEILFMGRCDRQVKINGKRIELDGIENALCAVDGVDSGAVVVRKDGRQIAAFYVSASGIDSAEVIDAMRRSLPAHMLPAAAVRLNALPVTSNGKVDRKKLAASELPDSSNNTAAFSELERSIAAICGEIFLTDSIAPEDDFYSLGGDSVSAMRIAAMLKNSFGVKLSPYDIFNNNTVRKLAVFVNSIAGGLTADGKKY